MFIGIMQSIEHFIHHTIFGHITSNMFCLMNKSINKFNSQNESRMRKAFAIFK